MAPSIGLEQFPVRSALECKFDIQRVCHNQLPTLNNRKRIVESPHDACALLAPSVNFHRSITHIRKKNNVLI